VITVTRSASNPRRSCAWHADDLYRAGERSFLEVQPLSSLLIAFVRSVRRILAVEHRIRVDCM